MILRRCAVFGVLTLIVVGLVCGRDFERASAQALLERHLEVVGGREALDSIQSVLVRGTWQTPSRKAPFEFRGSVSGAFLLTLQPVGAPTTQWGRDTRGNSWMESDGIIREVAGDELDWHALLLFAFLPQSHFAWLNELPTLQSVEFTSGLESLQLVKSKSDQPFPTLVFLKGTGRVRRIHTLEFRDYRLTEGIVVPFLIKESGESRFMAESVEFVQPMEDSVFDRPESP